MNEVNVRNYPISSVEVLDVEELGIDSRVEGFCDETMTLLFKDNPYFNPDLLPTNTIAENATTETAVCSSLACKMHGNTVSYITTESLCKLYHIIDNPAVSYIKTDALSKLYHVIDNPVVTYNLITKSYQEAYMYYVDKETMTGVVVSNTVNNTGYHMVYGIFAPRGYDKIKSYNDFNEMYLTDRTEVEAELLESLGVGDE